MKKRWFHTCHNRLKKFLSETENLKFLFITAICAYYYALRHSVVLDDAFVYFRLAENWIKLGKPVFNAGDSYFIATSPLWTFLLMLAKRVLPFWEVEIIAKMLGVLLLSIASYFAYLTYSPFLKKWAIFIATPFFLTPVIGSMLGNEIALLYVAMFGTFWACFRRQPVAIGIFLGIGYLARGEFVFMGLLIFIYYLDGAKKNAGLYQHAFSQLAKIYGIALCIALIWHSYSLLAFHNFFPSTLRVKMLQGHSGQWRLFHHSIWHALNGRLLGRRTYLLIFAGLGALWQPSLFGWMASYTLLHSIAYTLLKVPNYHWYYYDVYIFVLLLILFGIVRILVLLTPVNTSLTVPATKRSRTKQIFYVSLPRLVLIGFILWFFPVQFALFLPEYFPNIYQNNGKNEVYNTYMNLSKRLRHELEEHDIILTKMVGIISYYLPDYEIRDINGLASPNITRETMNSWEYFIDVYKPRFLIFSRKHSENIKIFEHSNNVYFYQLDFITTPSAKRHTGSVYKISQDIPPELEHLSILKKYGTLSRNVRYISLNGEILLFCQAPFESTLPVSPDTSHVEMQIGFMPGLFDHYQHASEVSNGVRVFIDALSKDQPITELGTYDIQPFENGKMSQPFTITVNLPQNMTALNVRLDPIQKNSKYDWTYIGNLKIH